MMMMMMRRRRRRSTACMEELVTCLFGHKPKLRDADSRVVTGSHAASAVVRVALTNSTQDLRTETHQRNKRHHEDHSAET
eukprot:1665214-Amphidinium_carterae.1